ncbi:cupin [Enterococcus sp. DIV0876]|uniref:cupin n=1 Tax=Enterococcus sp. DIV0876 TaxID=2774633 RepID=UPI003D2FB0DD
MEKYQGTGKISHIFESDNQVVTNLVLEAGKEIPTHDAPYTVVVVPVKGRIMFRGEDFEEEIYPGVIVRMLPDEPHSLTALADSELMVIKSRLA